MTPISRSFTRDPKRRILSILALCAILCPGIVPAQSTPNSAVDLGSEELALLQRLASDAPLDTRVALLRDAAADELEGHTNALAEIARSPYELQLRAEAIEFLSRISGERSRPVLEDLTTDPDPWVQALAAEALRVVDPPTPPSFERLASALAVTTEPADRRGLVSRLGALEDPRAQDLLWRIAADVTESPLVVATAVEGLVLPIGRPELQSKLESLLSARISEKRSSPSVIDALQSRLPSSNHIVPGQQSH